MGRAHIEALDLHVELIRNLGVWPGRDIHLNFEKSLVSTGAGHGGLYRGHLTYDLTRGGIVTDPASIVALPDWMIGNLDTSETYWVAGEMVDLVAAAAPAMPDEPLRVSDFPTPRGFAMLDKNTHFIDRRGRRLGYRALAWWPASYPFVPEWRRKLLEESPASVALTDSFVERQPGWEIAYFTHRDDGGDELIESERKRFEEVTRGTLLMPKLTLVHIGFWPEGFTIDNLLEYDLDLEKRQTFTEDELDLEAPPILAYDVVDGYAREMMRWTKAFFRLIQQRVAKTTSERPDRGTLRRLQRSGFLSGTEDIRVITLRRYKEGVEVDDVGEHDEAGVLWSHRWIVDGHWKNQWYPSLNDHRQIWIAPYVKGPKDRPLIVKDRVYKWTR